jgi:hypothetical protein
VERGREAPSGTVSMEGTRRILSERDPRMGPAPNNPRELRLRAPEGNGDGDGAEGSFLIGSTGDVKEPLPRNRRTEIADAGCGGGKGKNAGKEASGAD